VALEGQRGRVGDIQVRFSCTLALNRGARTPNMTTTMRKVVSPIFPVTNQSFDSKSILFVYFFCRLAMSQTYNARRENVFERSL
jgi:hypothetical protein